MWSRGEQIVVRYVRNGIVRGARPLIVVEERNGYLATWMPAGTLNGFPALADGRPIRAAPLPERFTADRKVVIRPWRGHGIVKLFPRAGAHSIWVFWHETGEPWGWYVNLEQQHRWWDRGLDTRDHVLDLWCTDARTWEWKDEDELAAAVAAGVVAPEAAAEIRAEGERVGGLIERWEPPFSDGWERFEPDPAWPVPTLPAGWDQL
jgi:hypothetical protein